MRLLFYNPTPAPAGVFQNEVYPAKGADPLSKLFYHYVTPILKVGYTRPLEADDLWQLTDDLKCKEIGDALEANLMARTPPSRRLAGYRDEVPSKPGSDRSEALPKPMDTHTYFEAHGPTAEEIEKYGKRKANKIASGAIVDEDGKIWDQSLWKAVFRTTRTPYFICSILMGGSQGLKITAPLVTRLIIREMTRAHNLAKATENGQSTEGFIRPKSVGYGILLAFALWLMNWAATLLNTLCHQRSAILGFSARAAVVDLISRKSMRLSTRSRIVMNNGRINTMVSADSSYLDWVYPASVEMPTHIPVIIVGSALLISQLGVSALVGLGILLFAGPVQGWMFKRLMKVRRAQTDEVDKRVRVLSEIVGSIRAVKLYAYEKHFGDKISTMRNLEHEKLRAYGIMRATVNSTFGFMPYLASIMTFITYGLLGNELDAETIFSALQYFQVLRFAFALMPVQFGALMDCLSALGRINEMLRAEELPPKINIVKDSEHAIVVNGDFDYDTAAPEANDKSDGAKNKAKVNGKKDSETKSEANSNSSSCVQVGEIAEKESDQKPFGLRDIDLRIPHGALVCIVGRVGTGKTALLSGLINEMRQSKGHVRFGGKVSYVPQIAWVQSGTVRDNVTFSHSGDADLARVNMVIDACALRPDVDRWQEADLTKIGEKGITLSGGQRQRICIARAAYEDSDIILLDDPLSAVDAHVGHHLVEKCIVTGPLAHRTRFLVTHQLDVLPRADLILVMDRNDQNEGRIVQHGTYGELLLQEGIFRNLIQEYGSAHGPDSQSEDEGDAKDKEPAQQAAKKDDEKMATGVITEDEERITGTVSWSTYTQYFKKIGPRWKLAMPLGFLVLAQGCTVGNNLFLGFWSGQTIDGFSQGQYMAIYGGLGLGIAVFTWFAVYTLILAAMSAAFTLFNGAWMHVMRSPTSWHDRTPTGRIISRLSKDFQNLDDRCAQYWNQLLTSILSVCGSAALIIYTFPWLGFIFIPLLSYYYLIANFYRQTSRELKRLDSNLRSHVFSSFSEQLAGLPIIRAFGQQRDFMHRLQVSVDNQNRANVLNITVQRWLAVRAEFCSALIILLVAIFGAVFRENVNPAKFGVVLTYAMATVYVLADLIPTFAFVEQEMNSVERVLHYNNLELEAAPTLPTDPKPEEWPTKGAVDFRSLEMRYRPDLPLVLKGLTSSIKPGEKVGIIGRTGAGKSSVAQALFRTVEPCGGSIVIDGIDLQTIGLETLRTRLAIIPQDAFLFSGSVRDNIDPAGERTDAELNDALSLIHSNPKASSSLREKFKLDATVMPEGSNFSAGEKQLLALMRALVRKCKVLLLDEATSSVDPETDALIQKIIQTEFSDVTLISIAHRLQTVAFYDRILCLDAGRVAEFDTPLALYDNPDSIFRSLCEKKSLHRKDIINIQAEAAANRKSG